MLLVLCRWPHIFFFFFFWPPHLDGGYCNICGLLPAGLYFQTIDHTKHHILHPLMAPKIGVTQSVKKSTLGCLPLARIIQILTDCWNILLKYWLGQAISEMLIQVQILSWWVLAESWDSLTNSQAKPRQEPSGHTLNGKTTELFRGIGTPTQRIQIYPFPGAGRVRGCHWFISFCPHSAIPELPIK